jgi:hypothetical protein
MARFLRFLCFIGGKLAGRLVIEIFRRSGGGRYIRMKNHTPVQSAPPLINAEFNSNGKLKLCKQWRLSSGKTM